MMLSVIVPCYNEEQVVSATHRRLSGVLMGITADYEIIFVDDGSRDGTAAILADLARADRRVRVIGLARNFGHQIAVSAGLSHASGEAVVLIDADLQDPPELIVDFVAKWREGYQVVFGTRLSREGETRFKTMSAQFFYYALNLVSEVPIPLNTGDFRLMDRMVVDALLAMPERHRMLRAMVSWVGFRQIAVPYDRSPRLDGVSKYPLKKMILFALDGVVSFSVAPLKFVTIFGCLIFFLAVLGVGYALFLRLFTSVWVEGWTLLFIVQLALGGAQFICLGIVGEYIGRIYSETKRRPLFVVATRLNFAGSEPNRKIMAAAAPAEPVEIAARQTAIP